MFTVVISGDRAKRPGQAKQIDYARHRDSLCVTCLDCLGRFLKELLEIVEGLIFRPIRPVSPEEQTDTTSSADELNFHVFSAITHFERRLNSERTRNGIAATGKCERKPGRPHPFRETVSGAKMLIETGMIPSRAANQLNVGRAAAYRIAKSIP